MAEEDLDFDDAPTVTIFARQNDRASDNSGQERYKYGVIPNFDANTMKRTVATTDKKPVMKRFLVHEHILCKASPVLRAAFQGNFSEAGTKTMSVDDLDADMVNQLVKWLYRGRRLPTKPETQEAEQLWYLNMARLVVVADVWQIDELEEDVIDGLVSHRGPTDKPPQWPVIEFAYANTGNLSYLRRWVVTWYTENIDFAFYDSSSARSTLALLPEFTNDLSMAFGKRVLWSRQSFFEMNRQERQLPIDAEPDLDIKR